jgi:C1A family cysteine protease
MYYELNKLHYAQTIPDQFDYPLDWIRFVQFAEKYKKTFSSEFDVEQRFLAFRQNWNRVIEHNTNKTNTFTTKINQYSDLKFDYYNENSVNFGQISHKLRGQNQPQYCTTNIYDFNETVPEFVDWRFRGIISPVKNQENCGSCWAIAASGAIESAWAIKTKKNIYPLSTQQILDCLPTYYNYDCNNGGHFDTVFENLIQTGNGLCLDSTYPYTSGKTGTINTCMKLLCEFKAYISSCSTIEPGHQLSLKTAVSKQPVAISIDASSWHFTHYSGGIISSSVFCGNSVQNHAALIVGYGTSISLAEDNTHLFQKYWLIKNSWSTNWGDNGYVKISRSDSISDVGVCGVATHPTFVVPL